VNARTGAGRGRRASRGESGVALITALIVVFLATAAAVAMSERQLFDLRRAENLQRLDQAVLAVKGAEAWAQGVLREELAADTGAARSPRPWILPTTEIPGGTVTAEIRDAGGCFNVNNLVDGAEPSAADLERFRRLLLALSIDAKLANAVLDWIDADLNTTLPGGAEDDYYSRLDPPYRSANRPVASISELLKVNGMNARTLDRMRPYVCALPGRSTINVNAANTLVLMSLADGISKSTAESIIGMRASRPFVQVEDFLKRLLTVQVEIAPDNLDVRSQYYEVLGQVKVGRVEVRAATLMAESNADVQIVSRRLGDEELGTGDTNE
jgi:general secretion pathway protein K